VKEYLFPTTEGNRDTEQADPSAEKIDGGDPGRISPLGRRAQAARELRHRCLLAREVARHAAHPERDWRALWERCGGSVPSAARELYSWLRTAVRQGGDGIFATKEQFADLIARHPKTVQYSWELLERRGLARIVPQYEPTPEQLKHLGIGQVQVANAYVLGPNATKVRRAQNRWKGRVATSEGPPDGPPTPPEGGSRRGKNFGKNAPPTALREQGTSYDVPASEQVDVAQRSSTAASRTPSVQRRASTVRAADVVMEVAASPLAAARREERSDSSSSQGLVVVRPQSNASSAREMASGKPVATSGRVAGSGPLSVSLEDRLASKNDERAVLEFLRGLTKRGAELVGEAVPQ
jgi:hypothetical protein